MSSSRARRTRRARRPSRLHRRHRSPGRTGPGCGSARRHRRRSSSCEDRRPRCSPPPRSWPPARCRPPSGSRAPTAPRARAEPRPSLECRESNRASRWSFYSKSDDSTEPVKRAIKARDSRIRSPLPSCPRRGGVQRRGGGSPSEPPVHFRSRALHNRPANGYAFGNCVPGDLRPPLRSGGLLYRGRLAHSIRMYPHMDFDASSAHDDGLVARHRTQGSSGRAPHSAGATRSTERRPRSGDRPETKVRRP